MKTAFDAIVIGAGPAGSTAALTLARRGWSVAIVEKHAFPRRKVCGEYASATNLALLRDLGVLETWRNCAGPEIRRVGFFSAETCASAPMPSNKDGAFGRALGRDRLDTLLLDAAKKAGSEVFQPWQAIAIESDGDGHCVAIRSQDEVRRLHAPVIVAAHGSWEPGSLPTQPAKNNRASDLLGFKAHFKNAALAPDLMPLLVFPGGYGGMVCADGGRLSVSCCIRRDHLAAVRAASGGASASEALWAHLTQSIRGVREAVGEAQLDGRWLAAGPIRPGIRARYADDIFRVGNAGGESHSIIAEGVTMAMQSSWLLKEELLRVDAATRAGRQVAGRRYAAEWVKMFAGRVYAAEALARLAMRPSTAKMIRRLVEPMPFLLTIGARISGKTRALPSLANEEKELRDSALGA